MTTAPAATTPAVRRTILASFLGSTFEWYDFGLYGLTAALVFNEVFFANQPAAIGTFLALATTAVGFVSRPVGGLIFGHFGDRVGRKKLLVITMMIMGIPTMLIGLLPGSAVIGGAAPVILLCLRFLQGIGLGGEYAGASLATIESVPVSRRGFFGAFPQVGNSVGALLASGLVLLATVIFPGSAFAEVGWRLPFLLSVVLLAYALFVRLRLQETGDFREVLASDSVQEVPLFALIRHHWRLLLLGLGARASDAIAGNVGATVFTAYLVTYLGIANGVPLLGGVIYGVVAIPFMLLMGRLADRIGRYRIFVIGFALIAIFIFPAFLLLNTRVVPLILLAMAVFWLANATQFAVQASFFADVFPTEVRYTAISVIYQLSSILGGLTPPTAFAILIATGGSPWLVAAAVAGIATISLICAAAMRPRRRTPNSSGAPSSVKE